MSDPNADQAELWTSQAGQKWVEQQVQMDAFLQPVLDGVLKRSPLKSGDHVLDIGCGTGASTLQAAEIVGANGFVMGADISPTMLAKAEIRARGLQNTRFCVADAASFAFDPNSFNHMISRFGVMFFANPGRAFSNIFNSLKSKAQVTFACWGPIPNNPWFTISAQAAKERLGAPPRVNPDDPGPFAFRDTDRVTGILSAAGFEQIAVDVEDVSLTPAGTPGEVAKLATSIGPAARTIDYFQGNEDDRAAITALVQRDFEQFETASGTHVPARINYFRAIRPAP